MREGNGWQRGADGARTGKPVRRLVVLLAGDGLALIIDVADGGLEVHALGRLGDQIGGFVRQACRRGRQSPCATRRGGWQP